MEKLRRIVAMVSVLVIVALVIAAFICGIAGSKYFWGMLFLAMTVPVVLWVFLWFTRLTADTSDDEEDVEETT